MITSFFSFLKVVFPINTLQHDWELVEEKQAAASVIVLAVSMLYIHNPNMHAEAHLQQLHV